MGGLQTVRHGAVVVLSGHEGDQSSAPITSTKCHCSPGSQMGRMCHRPACRDTSLSLSLVLSQAPLAGSGGGDLVEVKRDFSYEMVGSYYWPADYHCYTAVNYLCVDVSNSFMLLCNFI